MFCQVSLKRILGKDVHLEVRSTNCDPVPDGFRTDSPVKPPVTPQVKVNLTWSVFSAVSYPTDHRRIRQVFTRTARKEIKFANQRNIQVGQKKLQTAD